MPAEGVSGVAKAIWGNITGIAMPEIEKKMEKKGMPQNTFYVYLT